MPVDKWNEINENDKEKIISYVSGNIARVKDDIRNLDSNIYSGNMPMEVAATWVIMRGLDYVDDFVKNR